MIRVRVKGKVRVRVRVRSRAGVKVRVRAIVRVSPADTTIKVLLEYYSSTIRVRLGC